MNHCMIRPRGGRGLDFQVSIAFFGLQIPPVRGILDILTWGAVLMQGSDGLIRFACWLVALNGELLRQNDRILALFMPDTSVLVSDVWICCRDSPDFLLEGDSGRSRGEVGWLGGREWLAIVEALLRSDMEDVVVKYMIEWEIEKKCKDGSGKWMA